MKKLWRGLFDFEVKVMGSFCVGQRLYQQFSLSVHGYQ